MNCYAQEKSISPSPVKTNATALITELEAPINCPPDETLCFARIANARLDAAVAGLKAIVRVDEQREGIIADMQSRIDIRGKIIDDLKLVDKNSQTIDTRGQEISAIWREQHTEDKTMIADLQHDLDSCRSSQKYIAILSGIGGGFIGYKIRGAGQFQNPFTSNGATISGQANQLQRDFFQFNFAQTQAEQKMRKVLSDLKP